MERPRVTRKSKSEADRLLGLSKLLLRRRDFSGCRNHALQAQQSDPQLAGEQIIAISEVLLTSQTHINNGNKNYYSILQIDPLCHSQKLIKRKFKNLKFLLNPLNNTFPFAEEAFRLVCEAWQVLSNPTNKASYNEKFHGPRRHQLREGGGGSFWTACPYCYYAYEYDKIYVDCCLMCQNCRKGFHALAMPSPPAEVPGEDKYYCVFGFFPAGCSGNGEKKVRVGNLSCEFGSATRDFNANSQVKGEDFDGKREVLNECKKWPIMMKGAMARETVGRGKLDLNEEKGTEGKSFDFGSGKKRADADVVDWDEVVVISDDSGCELEEDVKEKEIPNGKSQQGGENVDGGITMQGIEKTNVFNLTEKPPMMRRKTVARNTKKITGTGNRNKKRVETTERGLNLNAELGKESKLPSVEFVKQGTGEKPQMLNEVKKPADGGRYTKTEIRKLQMMKSMI